MNPQDLSVSLTAAWEEVEIQRQQGNKTKAINLHLVA
jgi:hypothetical protein